MALTKVIGSGIGTVTNQFVDGNMATGSVVQVVTASHSSRVFIQKTVQLIWFCIRMVA